MIRRHATWMGIHPRSATFVSSLCFFFGEVFTRAYDTLLRTLLGAFRAYPAPRLWLLNRRDARSPNVPRFWLPFQRRTRYQNFGPVAGTICRSSPRSRVTKSRTRRYQRSNSASPLRGKTEIVCHIPPPNASGDFGKLKFCVRWAQRLQFAVTGMRCVRDIAARGPIHFGSDFTNGKGTSCCNPKLFP